MVNATVTITDFDGDTASAAVGIGGSLVFKDDGPDAVNDSTTQTTENTAVTVNVFANDAAGADGADLTTGITVVPGSLTGAGTLIYNNNGTFTYTPAANEEGTISFQYRLTDSDGDSDVATVTINLQPDSNPAPVAGAAAVDDDGLAGGNPASTAGDLNANAGESPVSASEAVFNGTLTANFGGDAPGTFTLAAMHGTSGMVGTETVSYTWNAVTGVLTASGSRGVLFTVSLNSTTGAFTVTLVDNVLHAAGGNENDATAALTFTATDSQGESANGTLTVTFDDDMPSATDEPQQNVAEGSSVNGTFDFAAGADGGGITHINGIALVFGGDGFSQSIDVGPGSIKVKADGTYVFTAENPAANGPVSGTFTVTDGDGDPVTANWAFNITDANVPTANPSTARLDDDGLAGGNPGGTGDLDANVGEAAPVNSSEAVFHGQLSFSAGGDTPATISFASMHGTSAMVGTETVTYSWNAATLTLTASGPRGVLFTLTLDSATSGQYTLTLNDNVLHSVGANENDATAALTFTVTDS
ncbi:MAG: cadherin-like domain-containing protein, partial [Actinobacteria bacterium]|nr:cadherin-like domain-containing protein [Actinomycetota bacterium]